MRGVLCFVCRWCVYEERLSGLPLGPSAVLLARVVGLFSSVLAFLGFVLWFLFTSACLTTTYLCNPYRYLGVGVAVRFVVISSSVLSSGAVALLLLFWWSRAARLLLIFCTTCRL